MAIVVLPQKQPTQNQTGIGQFTQALQPGIQAAMNAYMQKQMYAYQLKKQQEMAQEQAERYTNLAKENFPELFTPDYMGAIKGRGGEVNLAPGFQPTPEQLKQTYEYQSGQVTVPKQYMKFNMEAAGKRPGLEIPKEIAGFDYRVPQAVQPTYLYNPSTGQVEPLKLPTGEPLSSKDKVITKTETPEEKSAREQKESETKQSSKDAKDAEDFISGLAQQYKNTEAAMPDTSKSPAEQRWRGVGVKLGAWSGIGVTPKQTGEISTLKIRARSLIKKFEGGRLTDADITDAVNGMTDVGRTSAERLATIVNLATAIAADKGVDPEVAKNKLAGKLGMSIEEIDKIIGGAPSQSGSGSKQLPPGFSSDEWEVVE